MEATILLEEQYRPKNEEAVFDFKISDENLEKTTEGIVLPTGYKSKKVTKNHTLRGSNFETIEDLVENYGGRRSNIKSINKPENLMEPIICALIQNEKIIFKRELSRGKHGSAILSEVEGLKKNIEYVVKVPHSKTIPKCTTKRVVYTRNDNQGTTIFPEGSYSCNEELSEFIISLFVGDLSKSKQSINFLETYYFAICNDKKYMFMEKADSTLGAEFGHFSIEDVNSVYIQLLHSLALIQKKYSIVHGDLHLDNVFLKMDEKKCRSYKYGDKTVYAPYCNFIAYIGDWGRAVKYSEPCAGNSDILKGLYGDLCPNFFSSAYDIIVLTNSFQHMLRKNNMKSAFIKKIANWINSNIQNIAPEEVYYFKKDQNTGRPNPTALSNYFSHVSPLNILQNNDLMGKYMKGKSCIFGGEF